MAEEGLTFSLEEDLKADNDGKLKTQIQSQLLEQLTEIDKQLNSGLPPDEYAKLDTVKKGLQSAVLVLDKIWKQLHKA